MEYGLLGKSLPHSFSKEIHALLGNYEYKLTELEESEVGEFMIKKDFKAVNVTIPYKETVMPYLDEIDSFALAIGSVNTVVNRGGRLYGYNTDFEGMRAMLEKNGIDPKGKKVLIAGTGGTAKTAYAVTKHLGAGEIHRLSRSEREGAITYDEGIKNHGDAEILINTTPLGMFPRCGGGPVKLDLFKNLEAYVDVIYNPLKTETLIDAEKRGLRTAGGLYMLVRQAVKANEYFFGLEQPENLTDKIYGEILAGKQNIVLTGMPGSGKSTVGRILAERTGRGFIDTDEEIIKKTGREITEIFRTEGEKYFRDVESEVIKELSPRQGLVISTGGGAVLREENVSDLEMNGKIYFLNRPPENLLPTDDRPLADTGDKIKALYETRLPVYIRTADEIIDTGENPEENAKEIERRHFK